MTEHTIHLPRVPIRDLRERLGLDVYDFGYYFGVSKSRVERWEAGHEYPPMTMRVLIQLLDTLGDDVKHLLKQGMDQKTFEHNIVRALEA